MTNRVFLASLTRAQLVALAVQHSDLLVSEALALTNDQLCDDLEGLPQDLQLGVPA